MFYRLLDPTPPNRRALTYNILITSNYGDPDAQARPDAIQYIADMYE